jgi:hypothetical protein
MRECPVQILPFGHRIKGNRKMELMSKIFPGKKKPELDIGPIGKNRMHLFIVVQSIAFAFLLGITWLDEELLIPDFFSKFTILSTKNVAEILDSVWISLLFIFTVRYQIHSWKRIRLLEGVIPICMFCKKIRDEKSKWIQIEEYISEHSEADFTHSLCPSCGEKNYGEYYKKAAEASEASEEKATEEKPSEGG